MRLSLAIVIVLLATSLGFAQEPAEAVLRKEAGNYYLKKKQYDKARDEYLAALKTDPDYEDAHYNLGVVYFFRLSDYPRALYHFARYARLKPEASDIAQVRALAIQALEKIEESEREIYRSALDEGAPEALEAFIEAHPLSPYVPDAREKIERLRAYEEELREQTRATERAYQQALAQGTPEALDAFLLEHPNAARASEATQLRDQWTRRRAEDEAAFERAADAGTVEALEAFLAERPQSAAAPRARAMRDRLRAADEAFRIAAEARSAPALEVFLATYAGTPREEDARALLRELREEQARDLGERAWDAALQADTPQAYEAFRDGHPDHPRVEEAAQRAAALRGREEAWTAARNRDTRQAYAEFLEEHPEAPEATEAQERIAALRAAEAEAIRRESDRVWANAEDLHTAAAYDAFLAENPDHPMAEEARRRAAVLRQAAPSRAPDAQEARRQVAVQAEPSESTGPAGQEAPGEAPQGESTVLRDWELARQADTSRAYEAFLSQHPRSQEAGAARARLEELTPATGPSDTSHLPRGKRQDLERYRRMLLDE